jgi:hypothetical protein
MTALITPFRKHYEHSRSLDVAGQVEECADYVQHPEVLITEFLESYYLVERKLDPENQEALDGMEYEELVLEPFDDSVLLDVEEEEGHVERIECAGGAFDPLPEAQHPALRRRGLDYIGMREGSSRIVLGVTQAGEAETAYLLLLRALNCLSEIAPPFQLARLRRVVLHDLIGADATFDLQIGMPPPRESTAETMLWHLTWDMAEAIKRQILEHQQFDDTLGAIECLFVNSEAGSSQPAMRLAWRV